MMMQGTVAIGVVFQKLYMGRRALCVFYDTVIPYPLAEFRNGVGCKGCDVEKRQIE